MRGASSAGGDSQSRRKRPASGAAGDSVERAGSRNKISRNSSTAEASRTDTPRQGSTVGAEQQSLEPTRRSSRSIRGLLVPKRTIGSCIERLRPHLFTTQRCKRGLVSAVAEDFASGSDCTDESSNVEPDRPGSLRAGHCVLLLKDSCPDSLLHAPPDVASSVRAGLTKVVKVRPADMQRTALTLRHAGSAPHSATVGRGGCGVRATSHASATVPRAQVQLDGPRSAEIFSAPEYLAFFERIPEGLPKIKFYQLGPAHLLLCLRSHPPPLCLVTLPSDSGQQSTAGQLSDTILAARCFSALPAAGSECSTHRPPARSRPSTKPRSPPPSSAVGRAAVTAVSPLFSTHSLLPRSRDAMPRSLESLQAPPPACRVFADNFSAENCRRCHGRWVQERPAGPSWSGRLARRRLTIRSIRSSSLPGHRAAKVPRSTCRSTSLAVASVTRSAFLCFSTLACSVPALSLRCSKHRSLTAPRCTPPRNMKRRMAAGSGWTSGRWGPYKFLQHILTGGSRGKKETGPTTVDSVPCPPCLTERPPPQVYWNPNRGPVRKFMLSRAATDNRHSRPMTACTVTSLSLLARAPVVNTTYVGRGSARQLCLRRDSWGRRIWDPVRVSAPNGPNGPSGALQQL